MSFRSFQSRNHEHHNILFGHLLQCGQAWKKHKNKSWNKHPSLTAGEDDMHNRCGEKQNVSDNTLVVSCRHPQMTLSYSGLYRNNSGVSPYFDANMFIHIFFNMHEQKWRSVHRQNNKRREKGKKELNKRSKKACITCRSWTRATFLRIKLHLTGE